ncbi:hypothetical protein N9V60_03510 [Flavobacteriaceae bacterium]|nr:hypothetical protein [Flavobacteriaceae bacterium]MDB2340533.1 hypothetical protein [Flavobacteriaceae bacterium]
MKKQVISLIILLISFAGFSQKAMKSDALFSDQTPLEIKLGYSNKDMNRKTNDSTFIDTTLEFLQNEKWSSLEVNLRARGNFRRNECYFPPIKMKIKKDQYQGTIFDGNKTMKLVLPCKLESENNDNILQEYIAYKIYERISPFHFKTRRVNIDFSEPKGKKIKKFALKGFLIEDDKRVAKRHEGKVFERYIHPMAMQHLTSVQNAFFQYLLGNTDFSVAYQHNGKLLYVNKEIIPLPYDFDMTGWVNPSYATVNTTLGINSVQDRKYRGFKREQQYFDEVRQQFLDQKADLMKMISSFEGEFSNQSEYENMFEFLKSFYDVLEDDSKFQKSIVEDSRTK